jgi:hypothetical protein
VEPAPLQRQISKGPLVAKRPRQVFLGELAQQPPHVARVGVLVHAVFADPSSYLASLPLRV